MWDRWEKIPTLVRWTPSGTVTGSILRDICAALDLLEIFKRTDGQIPCLLCDGHKSRFDEAFLRYIHDPAHKWGCGVGCPYGTSLWQLADGSEQNGNNNQLNTKNKKKRYDYKIELGLPGQLERYEIIPLLNESWANSFGKVSSNITAIADRGWNPLNRCLLDHHEIVRTVTHLDWRGRRKHLWWCWSNKNTNWRTH